MTWRVLVGFNAPVGKTEQRFEPDDEFSDKLLAGKVTAELAAAGVIVKEDRNAAR